MIHSSYNTPHNKAAKAKNKPSTPAEIGTWKRCCNPKPMAQKSSNKASCAVVLIIEWPVWVDKAVFMMGFLSFNADIVSRLDVAYYEYSYQNYE